MSFASSIAAPARGAMTGARQLLRGGTLTSMARAVGVVVGAGALAAAYQVASEEGRAFVNGLRSNAAERRARNQVVTLMLLDSNLPLPVLDKLRKSRDVFAAAVAMAFDEKTDEAVRSMLRDVLKNMLPKHQAEMA